LLDTYGKGEKLHDIFNQMRGEHTLPRAANSYAQERAYRKRIRGGPDKKRGITSLTNHLHREER